MTVRIHIDFIVLPHWDIRPPAPWRAILLSDIILTLSQQVLGYPNNTKRQARTWQVSVLKSCVWSDQASNPQCLDLNPQSSDFPIFQHGRRMLYSFGPVWSWIMSFTSTNTGLPPWYINETISFIQLQSYSWNSIIINIIHVVKMRYLALHGSDNFLKLHGLTKGSNFQNQNNRSRSDSTCLT